MEVKAYATSLDSVADLKRYIHGSCSWGAVGVFGEAKGLGADINRLGTGNSSTTPRCFATTLFSGTTELGLEIAYMLS